MNHVNLRALLGLLAVGLLVTCVGADAQNRNAGDNKHHTGAYMDCAKACDACARICDACAAHCAMLLAEGKKEHLTTLQTCADCATFCSAAACITARQGPFSDAICTGCAEACKRCGDACAKFADDPMMKQCAEECRRCEQACREMLKHVGHGAKAR